VDQAKRLPYSRTSERCFTWVSSSLFHKRYTKLKRLKRDKHSSLLRKFVVYSLKESYNIGHRPKKLARDERTSLFGLVVNGKEKKFYKIDTRMASSLTATSVSFGATLKSSLKSEKKMEVKY
jgi:hypothetical protein